MSTNTPQVKATQLELERKVSREETVVRARGHLTFDVAAHFKQEVRPLIAETESLVLDFTEVSYMDSSGLGAVMSLYVSAKKAGCGFHLINFNQRIRQLLGLTNVLAIFETCGKYMIKIP